jgi:hypothetical protein
VAKKKKMSSLQKDVATQKEQKEEKKEIEAKEVLPFDESFYTDESTFRQMPLWTRSYIYLCHLSAQESQAYLELCKDDPYEMLQIPQQDPRWHKGRGTRFTFSNAANASGKYYQGTAFENVAKRHAPREMSVCAQEGIDNEKYARQFYEQKQRALLQESFQNHLEKTPDEPVLKHRDCLIPLRKNKNSNKWICPDLRVVEVGFAISFADPHTGGSSDGNVTIDGIVYWIVEFKYPSEYVDRQPYLVTPFYYIDQIMSNLYVTREYHPKTLFMDFVAYSTRYETTIQSFDLDDDYFYGQYKPMEHRYFFLLFFPSLVYKKRFCEQFQKRIFSEGKKNSFTTWKAKVTEVSF